MKNRKRVLHIIQSLDNGGCENMLLRTLPLLTEEFEHHIITLKNPGELAQRFSERGILVTTIYQKNIFEIRAYKRILSEIRKLNPSVIITYLFHADMIGRLFLQRNISTPIIPFLRTTYNHHKYLIARIFEWLTKPLVKQYLANSEAVKRFYSVRLGVDTKKISVIPNGIDTDCFATITPNSDLKRSLGINLGDFVIICVANFHINKGHRYLLEAFERLYKKSKARENLKLFLVGGGPERNNLQHQISGYQSKENIIFLKQRADVPQLLKVANLFVLPTLFEGQSNAILEAMAAGIPVITTDIAENRIILKNNTDSLLVPIRNSTALTQSIQKLQDNPLVRSAFAQKAMENIQQHFSLKKVVLRWKNFLIKTTS